MNTKPENKQTNIQQPINTIDVFELAGIFWRHWKIIVTFSIIGLIVGIAVARYTRDSFENKTMLQLDTKSKSGKAVADIGDLFDAQSPAVAEIHLIKS